MTKYLLVFIVGTIETFLYTAWCISANKKELYKSSALMFIYMLIYLGIISFAFKDANTIGLIVVYAISCGVGNFLELFWEGKHKNVYTKTK